MVSTVNKTESEHVNSAQPMAEHSELSLGERLGRLHRLWRMVADGELSPLGLTHSRWTALWKLYRIGQDVSQKHLAEALEIELASLMRTLGQLEQQGLVIRHCCEHDKRVRRVALTEAGLAVLDQMEAKIIRVRAELLSGVSLEMQAQFEQTLNQISHNAAARLEATATKAQE